MSAPEILLKEWRDSENKGPAEAAAACDVSRQTWWRWENGKSLVDRDKLDKVADVTGIAKHQLRPDLVALLGAA